MTPEKRLTGNAMGDPRALDRRSAIMSYASQNTPRAALGDSWDTVKSLSAAVDPYLPEAICRIDQIRALRKDRTPLQAIFGKAPTVPVPTCVRVPAGQRGIGIEKAVKSLRAAAYAYEHPIVVWAGLTAVLVVPFLAGFAVGRRSR